MVVVTPLGTFLHERCARGESQTAPTLEGIACGSHSFQGDWGKEVAVEVACGHGLAVQQQLGTLDIARQLHPLGLHIAKTEGRISLQRIGRRAETPRELALHGVGRAASRTALELHGRVDARHQLINQLCGTGCLEHAAAHETIGIDEAASEVGVLQQVLEEGNKLYLCCDAAQRGGIELVESPVLTVHEHIDGRVAVE